MSGISAVLAGMAASGLRLVAVSTAQANGASLTLAKPTGAALGDVLIAGVFCEDAVAFSTLSGWTDVEDTGGGLLTRKVAGASEPTSYAFPLATGSKQMSGFMLALRGGAFDGSGGMGSLGASAVAPSFTMTGAGMVFAAYFVENAGRTFTTPTGFTAVSSDSDGTKPSWALFSRAATAGSTGTASSATTTSSRGIQFGIREA